MQITDFYDLSPKDLKGRPYRFNQLKNKIVLIVNVASECGFTPQYKGLQELKEKFASQPVEIIGFPCNQFGHQEPGSNEDIELFCQLYFGITFPVLSKVEANGANADPVYKYLKAQKRGFLGMHRVKWNFEKFLVDQNGEVVARFSTFTKPEMVGEKIEEMLKQQGKSF
ncbi:Glutathione peroxidase [Candida maltosa Xu316]|uniref:Glutathione peroxidase n=1 Tax=Candida maltosa (strain Xu316) TaxID=1245528 RepID=M3JTQ4_CANMX|nr:Glutathione peroxidase [Candida maltosa Xu316]